MTRTTLLRSTVIDGHDRLMPFCRPKRLPPETPWRTRFLVLSSDLRTAVLEFCWVSGVLLLGLVGTAVLWWRAGDLIPAHQLITWSIEATAPFAILTILFALLIALGSGLRAFAARNCIRHSICPSCCYALSGLPVAADGCCVCPECGGAW